MYTQTSYTIREISDITGKTRRTLSRIVKEKRIPHRRVNGNGGDRIVVDLRDCPPDIQNVLLERQRSDRLRILGDAGPVATAPATAPAHNNKEGDPDAAPGDESSPAPVPALRPPSFSPVPAPTLTGLMGLPDPACGDPWNALPETCRSKGYDILLLVNRLREVRARAGRGKDAALNAFAASVGHHPHSLLRYLQRADRAVEEARNEGSDTIKAQILALAPKHGRTRDRIVAYDTEAVSYALSLYADPDMRNMSQVYEQVKTMAQARHWRIGTYATLCNYLKRLDRSTATLARHGNKAFEADRQVKILRNYDEIPPLFMLCGDHHIFDVFVKLPDGKGGWTYRRPWLTSWMDMRTRSLVGWCISFAPNSRTIAMALHHAILPKNDPDFPQHGLPSSVYIDNGKDYRSKYLSGEEISIGKIDYPDIMERYAALGIDPFYIDLEYDEGQEVWVKRRGDRAHQVKGVRVGGVYARLGIGQRYATAYHPWAKPVERFHRTLVQSFSRELPGWCGSGHEQRPEKLAFELRSGHAILTIEQFCPRFYDWVVNGYHQTPHRGHGMNGMTPTEAFRALMPEPRPVDPALLDFALMKKENVTVHNWGFVLNSREFEPDVAANLQGARIWNALIGSRVTVFYDFDYKAVRIYRDGSYCCDARPLARASFVTPNDPAMTDKLRLAAWQRRDAAGKILSFANAADAARTGDETAALLALTQGDGDRPKALPDPPEDDGPLPTGDAPPISSHDPEDDVVPITQDERYRLLLKKIARGRDLTPEQQAFREAFERSREYQESQQLYEETLKYMEYLSAKGGE